ncbi:MAG: ubiquinone biosynthesis protein [Bdellovibrionales bacterium RBG_16_40_8]|nr:MAG: ubiquinone biosynthesis protein [Bdellovibrionales bacterium RBG_16_40_8]
MPVGASDLTTAERLRSAFEELGPTFIKLGQLLATRPDLIPEEYTSEFSKFHDRVTPLSYSDIEKELKSHFSSKIESIFSSFDREALAAGSIAQVHLARLKNGERVVVKVQRPRVADTIREDVGVLYFLAGLLEKYVPEAKIFNPLAVVDEFARTLDFETNFVIEANNIRRFQENFIKEPNIKIPKVYDEFSGRKVLVLEELEGIPLSQKNALDQEGINPESVLRTGLRCYLKMVFTDGLFHGDLHAGNMFVLPNNRIGLIDFGVIGRLNRKTQGAIANMFVALASEDYDRFAYEYIDLAPYTDQVDVDLFARDLRDMIAPYYGLTLKHVNVGKLMMNSAALASRYGLRLPPELIMFCKSIISIEGMGRVIMKDFNFLIYALEFAAELVQSRAEPTKILRDISSVGRDVNSLMASLPRQIKQIMLRLSSPDFVLKTQIHEIENLRVTTKNAANTMFLGVIVASLVLSAAILHIWDQGPTIAGMSAISVINYVLAIMLAGLAFINYLKK